MGRNLCLSMLAILLLLTGCGRSLDEGEGVPDVISMRPPPREDPVVEAGDSDEVEALVEVEEEAAAVVESSDPFVQQINAADPVQGMELFNVINDSGFACASCHSAETDQRLVGPGLWGLPSRTDEREAGISPHRYMYNSIVNPNDYIVESYTEGLMPPNYSDLFTEEELQHLTAYLMTLDEQPVVAVAEAPAGEDAPAEEEGDEAVAQAPTATPTITPIPATPTPTFTPVPPDPIVWLAQNSVPALGETIYNEREIDGATCASCHGTGEDNDLTDVVAMARQAEEPTELYLYNAILNPEAHTTNYGEALTISEVTDLVAYLVTLEGGDASALSTGGGEEMSIAERIASADPVNGEQLFAELNDTGFACNSCHSAETTDRMVGPGLHGIPARAAERVEGESAEEYIYNSIVHPNDYIVEDYTENLMPQNYSEIYTEQENYDLAAYLMTLED